MTELALREHTQVFFERVGDAVIGDDATVLHSQDALRCLSDAAVVGDDHDSCALAAVEFGEQGQNLLAALAVEGATRFIGQDKYRTVSERPSYCDALPLSA